MYARKQSFLILLSLGLLIYNKAIADEYSNYLQRLNIPRWVDNLFYEKQLNDKYELSFAINPFYLRGDFNGDNEADIAILIKEKVSNKRGIAVIHYLSNNIYILGAGNSIGNGGDDFIWMSNWAVERKGKVCRGADESPPPKLKAEALYVEKAESASGLIYWDGKKYAWYQQGD